MSVCISYCCGFVGLNTLMHAAAFWPHVSLPWVLITTRIMMVAKRALEYKNNDDKKLNFNLASHIGIPYIVRHLRFRLAIATYANTVATSKDVCNACI